MTAPTCDFQELFQGYFDILSPKEVAFLLGDPFYVEERAESRLGQLWHVHVPEAAAALDARTALRVWASRDTRRSVVYSRARFNRKAQTVSQTVVVHDEKGGVFTGSETIEALGPLNTRATRAEIRLHSHYKRANFNWLRKRAAEECADKMRKAGVRI